MMNQPERPQPNRVTIEDLLRVKRAERPSVEFWSHFERDLRAKQLAAIVEPRPWWVKLRLPQVARTAARFQIPVGAAAALVLSFIVVREYRPVNAAPDTVETSPVARFVEPVAVASTGIPTAKTISDAVAVVTPILESSSRITQVSEVIEPLPVGSGALLAMIPWAAPQQAVEQDVSILSSAPGELPQVHFASFIKPMRELHFEGSVDVEPILVSATVEQPIAEIANVVAVTPESPREVRRNHILSSLVVADNSSDADRAVLVQAREVVANSLTDDRLYDSVRRVGMGGDRLTLKF